MQKPYLNINKDKDNFIKRKGFFSLVNNNSGQVILFFVIIE